MKKSNGRWQRTAVCDHCGYFYPYFTVDNIFGTTITLTEDVCPDCGEMLSKNLLGNVLAGVHLVTARRVYITEPWWKFWSPNRYRYTWEIKKDAER